MGNSKGSSPQGNTTVTQNSAPWGPQQPYLLAGLNSARNLYKTDPVTPYPGEQVASLTPQQQEALSGFANLGANGTPVGNAADSSVTNLLRGYGSPLVGQGAGILTNAATAAGNNPATGLLTNTATGNFAGNPGATGLLTTANGSTAGYDNPFLNDTFNKAASAVDSNEAGLFSSAGRYGSGAMQHDLSDNLNNLATSIYGGNYQSAAARQLAAQQELAGLQTGAQGTLGSQALTGAGLLGQIGGQVGSLGSAADTHTIQAGAIAPGLASNDFSNLSNLFSAGQTQQQQNQALINEAMAKYQQGQLDPWQTLQMYLGGVSGNLGSNSTTTSPFFGNPVGNGIATGLGGLALFNGANNAGLFSSIGGLFGSGATNAPSSMGPFLSDALASGG